MKIRYITPEDRLEEISNVYEKSWRYAYQNIIPQSYLDSIPAGSWADNINRDGRKNIVMVEKDTEKIGGKELREVIYEYRP